MNVLSAPTFHYPIIILILLACVLIVSCDSSDYVYVGEKTFKKQIPHLKDGYVDFVAQVDPDKKTGYKHYGISWPVIKEKSFTKRNKISNELCNLILNIINKNQRYTGYGWYPTYEIFAKYSVPYFYIYQSDRYQKFIFDFNNLHISTEGRKFAFTKEEANLLKNKLDALLAM